MTLRQKLLWAQAPLGIALVLVSVLFLRSMDAMRTDSQSILKDNFRSVLAAERMSDALDDMDQAAVGQVLGLDASLAGPAHAAGERFESELRVQEANVTEPGEGDATARVRSQWDAYRVALGKLPQASDPPAFYQRELRPLLLGARGACNDILAVNQDAIVRKSDAVKAIISRNSTALSLATLAACLVGLVATGALTNRLLRPLGVLSQSVRRVGEGDLDARIQLHGDDELAALAREFNAMTERMKRYRQSSLGELLEAQSAAQASIDSLPDPVLVFDAQGALLNVNEPAERLLAVSVEKGTAGLGGPNPALAAALDRSKAHVLGGHGPYVPRGFEEAVSASTSEGQRYFLARASPIYAAAPGITAVTGVTAVLQDVTRVRLFDELQNDVVATVAHEFRTPLTSLRMAVHLCIEGGVGPLTPKQADLLYGAREDTERLQAMVDDLLDLARMQAGQAGLQLRDVSVEELLAQVVTQHREEARAAQLELRAEPAPQGLSLSLDTERLGLVFNNLVGNALHHTPPGGHVDLRVRPEPGWVRFEVADTGPGIPPEHQARVFDKFFQVPGRRSGAAGLGLYICREVVHAHGGDIGVVSAAGQGATFWFRLPKDGLGAAAAGPATS